MAARAPQDVLKSHQDFLDKVRAQIKAVAEGKSPAPPLPLRDKRFLLQEAQARLDAARKAREEASQRFDREIAEQEKTIARLQKEIAAGEVPQSQGKVKSTSETGQQPSQSAKTEASGRPSAKKARKADKAHRT